MSSWRKSPVIAVTVACLILVVQFAVPISRLGDHNLAARFGWQMFSGAAGVPQFVVETPGGDIEIVLEDYVARVRADIDLSRFPSHLCEVVPGAEAVRWGEDSYLC